MQQNPSKPASANDSLWSALSLAWELGYLIAIPAVLFGMGGAYLDKHLHMSPLFMIAGFLLAFTTSSVFVYRKVRSLTPR